MRSTETKKAAFNAEFQRLIKAHKRLIYKVCYSYCRYPDDREDLAQEIILQLWKAYGRYDAQYKISTWIYRIALNVAISFYRSETKWRKAVQPLDEHVLIVADTGHTAELEKDIEQLYCFIDSLDEVNRALMLLYLDGVEHKSIAIILGISRTNVGTKINRLKEKLRQAWIEENRRLS